MEMKNSSQLETASLHIACAGGLVGIGHDRHAKIKMRLLDRMCYYLFHSTFLLTNVILQQPIESRFPTCSKFQMTTCCVSTNSSKSSLVLSPVDPPVQLCLDTLHRHSTRYTDRQDRPYGVMLQTIPDRINSLFY